jgi:hypothetical protein
MKQDVVSLLFFIDNFKKNDRDITHKFSTNISTNICSLLLLELLYNYIMIMSKIILCGVIQKKKLKFK